MGAGPLSSCLAEFKTSFPLLKLAAGREGEARGGSAGWEELRFGLNAEVFVSALMSPARSPG